MFSPCFVRLLLRALVVLVILAVPTGCSRARPRYVRRPVPSRVALVIGVTQYDYWNNLPNANRDATDVYNELRALGFNDRSVLLTTSPTEPLTRQHLLERIEAFTSRLRAEDMVVFYFAGHGSSLGGAYDGDPHDYLLPQDFPGVEVLHRNPGETQDGAAARLLGGYAIDVRQEVLARLGGAGSAVVFIDACRDQRVLAALRAASGSETILGRMRGLSIERSEPKVHVLFSTAEGTGAFDGAQGRHSPFTGTLLDYLRRRTDLTIASLAARIRDDVRDMTDGQQEPRYLGASDLPVYLVSGEIDVPAPVETGGSGAEGGRCPAGMVYLPGGEFMMGSPSGVGESDEHPQHRVHVSGFCIDRTEVSVATYRTCVEAGACTAPDSTTGNAYCNWGRSGADDHPVNCVDWRQSKTFCEWSGHDGGARRLLREAEWEYAAGGRHGTTYPWGNEATDGSRANLCGAECELGWRNANWRDEFARTAPVSSLPSGATPEGVLGLGGNVWEWVEDEYVSDGYAQHDAEGHLRARDVDRNISRVLRGGGWYGVDAAAARAADRGRVGFTHRIGDVGFRCAAGAR